MKWISVKDKLPETVGHSVDYLVYMTFGDCKIVSWMNIGGWCWSDEYSKDITHWMPLPDAPEVSVNDTDDFPSCPTGCECPSDKGCGIG